MLRIIVCVFLIVFAFPLYGARVLEIPYVKFEIAENWKCRSFGPYWGCHHRFSKGEKPAFIIVMGQLKPGTDTESIYDRTFGYKNSSKSAPITVNRHTWWEVFNQSGFASYTVRSVCGDSVL